MFPWDKRFTEYQRQLLLSFASFLVSFVEATVQDAAAQPAAATGATTSSASAAPTRHGLALLTTLLAAGLVAIALVLAALPVVGRQSTTSSPHCERCQETGRSMLRNRPPQEDTSRRR